MKKTNYRLSALALVLTVALLGGCAKNAEAVTTASETTASETAEVTAAASETAEEATAAEEVTEEADETDETEEAPEDEAAPEVTVEVYDIAKYGNLLLYMYGADFMEKGFEYGDIVEVTVAGQTWAVPLCSSYSDVDSGEAVLRVSAADEAVVLAINMGDFATGAGIAAKTAIDEEPGYRWDYLIETPVQVKIVLKEAAGYREQWLIRQLVRTDERADYAHLTDEAFANFRVIDTAGMGENKLYRSSSPIKPELGRSIYADQAARAAGIATVINLADASNTYELPEGAYYPTCNVIYLNLNLDFLAEDTVSNLARGLRFMIENEAPYLVHCNEGKDRAGFVSALLECLMGAPIDEVIEDYMETYYNFYGVEKGTEKYDAVVNNNIISKLITIFNVDDVYTADLAAEAEEYITEVLGLSADEVSALKAKLAPDPAN